LAEVLTLRLMEKTVYWSYMPEN